MKPGRTVLKNYFPASGAALDAARASSLAAIPDGTAKDAGIAAGEAAAAAMILARLNDGSAPPSFPCRRQPIPACGSPRPAALRAPVCFFSGGM